jgi:predicted ester cyclase
MNPRHATSTKQNKAISFRRVEEIWHNADLPAALAVVDHLIADNYTAHCPGASDITGREGFKQFVSSIRTAFPDLHFSVEYLLAEADRVVGRYRGRATHLGNLVGIPPTGRSVIVSWIDMSRIADGKVAEDWLHFDQLGLLCQLGVIAIPRQSNR